MTNAIDTEASRIASAALAAVALNPVSNDDWSITCGSELADYCLTGMDGEECDDVAARLDLDADDLRGAVREALEAGFDSEVHGNA